MLLFKLLTKRLKNMQNKIKVWYDKNAKDRQICSLVVNTSRSFPLSPGM